MGLAVVAAVLQNASLISTRIVLLRDHPIGLRRPRHTLGPLRGGPNIQSSLIHEQTAPVPCKLRTPVSTTIAELAPQTSRR